MTLFELLACVFLEKLKLSQLIFIILYTWLIEHIVYGFVLVVDPELSFPGDSSNLNKLFISPL